MYDEAHVRFVDAHAERDGRYDYIYLVVLEGVLHVRALCRVEPGMVVACAYAVLLEELRNALHGLARQTVHDAALTGPPARYGQGRFLCRAPERVAFGEGMQVQVLAEERAAVTRGRAHPELLYDVCCHLRRSRRGQSQHRDLRKALF